MQSAINLVIFPAQLSYYPSIKKILALKLCKSSGKHFRIFQKCIFSRQSRCHLPVHMWDRSHIIQYNLVWVWSLKRHWTQSSHHLWFPIVHGFGSAVNSGSSLPWSFKILKTHWLMQDIIVSHYFSHLKNPYFQDSNLFHIPRTENAIAYNPHEQASWLTESNPKS